MSSVSFLSALLVAVLLCGCVGSPTATSPFPVEEEPERSFSLSYVTDLSNLPVGETIELWIPVPSDDPQQRIRKLGWDGPLTGSLQVEPVYGNRMLHFKGVIPADTLQFVVEYQVDRWKYESDFEELAEDGARDGVEFDKYLQPSRLGAVTPQVKEEASALAAGKTETLQKARAFYDHVLANMRYDKNHQGWGRGSIDHACSVGKGNCTDYHTYFTSLCLAEEIPSRFQIGIYGRFEAQAEPYETGGYHCWAEFHVPGKTWVPVDISEADKDPRRVEEFFGGHTSNRVTLSTGRDLNLEPRQAGEPLNYFLFPYAEVGGQALGADQCSKTTIWTDLSGS